MKNRMVAQIRGYIHGVSDRFIGDTLFAFEQFEDMFIRGLLFGAVSQIFTTKIKIKSIQKF